MERRRSGVAVVLSGGGARGPYQAGALSVLLPALEAQGQRPTVFLGTSAGALNAVAFASVSHLQAAEAAARVLELWREVRAGSVFRSPLDAALSAIVARMSGPGRRRASAMLDTAPLAATVAGVFDWDRLHDNVRRGLVSVGVVATNWSSRRSTVFIEGAPGVRRPPPDFERSIDYVPTELAPRHVLASTAIPVLFPAVEIAEPETVADWYFDGGVRLNAPLRPALALGVERVVVVATTPAEAQSARMQGQTGWTPTRAGGADQLLYAILEDRMVEDLRKLARRNRGSTADGRTGDDAIEWLFAGPAPGDAGQLARLVGEVLQGRAGPGRRRHGAVSRAMRRAVGHWLARDPYREELLSYLFFHPEFIDGAIRLGQNDGRRALDRAGGVRWRLTGESAATA